MVIEYFSSLQVFCLFHVNFVENCCMGNGILYFGHISQIFFKILSGYL